MVCPKHNLPMLDQDGVAICPKCMRVAVIGVTVFIVITVVFFLLVVW